MRKINPKFNKNDRVEFILRDDTVKSGCGHHLGYVKRAVAKKRLFRKAVVFYDICEASREERYLWSGIPESDILGTVEFQRKDRQADNKGESRSARQTENGNQ